MGLAAKLVAVLCLAALLVLAGIGAMQYHVSTQAAEREVQQTLKIVLDRLSVSLPLSLDEVDIGTLTETIRSEFASPEIHTILIWDQTHARLLKGLGRSAQGLLREVSRAREEPHLISAMRELSLSREMGPGRKELLGNVEVFVSKAPVLQRLHRNLLRNLAQQAVLVALLVLILAYVSGRYVVRPLESIRQVISPRQPRGKSAQALTGSSSITPQDQAQSNSSPARRMPPVERLKPERLTPAFKEILDMASDLQRMLDALDQQRQELAAKEEDLRITLDSIGDAVIATDPEGTIVRMNPVAEKLTGWRMADARGVELKHVFNVVDRAGRTPIRDPVKVVMASGAAMEIVKGSLLIAKDGKECLIADSAAPIRGDSGQVVGVVLVFRDITEQATLEDQLMRVHKLDAIGQLAGGVAHDFNNMLAGILGAAEMLQLTTENDPRAGRYVALIQDAAQKASNLTGKLLAIGRRGPRATQLLDGHEALRGATELLKRSIDRRITIHLKLDAAQTTLRGDMTQLQNLFINLGVNARDAMPHGGRITFSTQNVNLGPAYCRASPFKLKPGTYLQFTVRDTGSGMDQEVLAHLFEPFFTTKESGKGTGLGLAAVYSAVQDHHGSIYVYSEPGRGTVFHIYLPASAASPPSPKSDARVDQSVPGSGCILVIEDEAVIRDTAQAQLEALGYEVILAADGVEGLVAYQRHRNRIDAVVLDLIMPRMNGEECFRALKKINPDIKVLVASGFVREVDIRQLLDEGVRGFMQKPYRRAQLSKQLARILAR
ncbi:MAG: ATP-binding protein [Desulfobacterales bacterium]